MSTYAVLLRGINVGGHNRLAMAELRDVLTDAGYGDVRTYVASGNIVVRSGANEAAVVAGIHDLIASAFKLDIPIVVRAAAQLKKVVSGNPFLNPDADPGRQLHVAFLSANPAAARVANVDPTRNAPDELRVVGREVYLWCPNGLGQSKVFNGVEKALGCDATVRNWRTVTELVRMMST